MTTGNTTQAPAATPDTQKKAKNSVTISFDEQDAALFAKIQKLALADDRTEAKFLLLHLRKSLNKD